MEHLLCPRPCPVSPAVSHLINPCNKPVKETALLLLISCENRFQRQVTQCHIANNQRSGQCNPELLVNHSFNKTLLSSYHLSSIRYTSVNKTAKNSCTPYGDYILEDVEGEDKQ